MAQIYFSMVITVLSNVFYHIFQKSISNNLNPFISLIVTYICAIAISIMLLPLYPTEFGIIQSIKAINWSSFALAVPVIGLELGFLLAYRAGWDISTAGIFSNVVVAIFLFPIGLWIYKENLSTTNIIGISLCIVGLVLVKN